jgi:hypothetical protein
MSQLHLLPPCCTVASCAQVALLDSPSNRRLLGFPFHSAFRTARRTLLQAGYKTVTAGLYTSRVTLAPSVTPTQAAEIMSALQSLAKKSPGPGAATVTPSGPSPSPSPTLPAGPGPVLPPLGLIRPPGLPLLPGANAANATALPGANAANATTPALPGAAGANATAAAGANAAAGPLPGATAPNAASATANATAPAGANATGRQTSAHCLFVP